MVHLQSIPLATSSSSSKVKMNVKAPSLCGPSDDEDEGDDEGDDEVRSNRLEITIIMRVR